MSYNTYLLVLSQLSTRRKAECVVQDCQIFVESNADRWQLSTKIFDSNGSKMPSFLQESLSRKGLLRWQERGAYLKFDPKTSHIYLIQEIHGSKKYIAFRSFISDFTAVAKEWKEMLIDCDESFRHIG